MTTKRPWYPFYIADYRADTARLTAAQHGAYRNLIDEYWLRGGLPTDELSLANIARMSLEEWRCNCIIVASYFASDWTHKRIDAELKKCENVSKSRTKAAAKRWGNKRKLKHAKASISHHANASESHTTLHTSQIEESIPYKDPLSNNRRSQASTCERFYAVYPKHVGKDTAAAAFAKRVKQGVDPEHIIAAAGKFAKACHSAATEKRFIKAPAVWLNGGCYDDEDLPEAANHTMNGHSISPQRESNYSREMRRLAEQHETELKGKNEH